MKVDTPRVRRLSSSRYPQLSIIPRGQPLVSHEAIVNLIASTTTRTGLIVQAALDTNVYETGLKVSDEEMAGLRLTACDFHGEWNYIIAPRKKRN
ncbi:MAG TPA: hypothetical protein VKU02_27295 [Gemmataceae bacterium]|nr:hypothetical protein [Gemmataceae bacterium]